MNYEESYESDIQKKFERELQNMERTRQNQNENEEQDQGEDNNEEQEDHQGGEEDDQNYQNGEDHEYQGEEGGEHYDQQEDHQQNDGTDQQEYEHQENQQNEEYNNNDESHHQQNTDREEGQYNEQDQDPEEVDQNNHSNQEDRFDANGEKEQVSNKVETRQNPDGSTTTTTYTTVTKTKRVDLNDYSMPTIEEQDSQRNTQTMKAKNEVQKQVDYTPKALAKNNNDLISQVSSQKQVIQSLKEELKDEREINTIQALEIESLKQLVRKLQGNIDSLNRKSSGGMSTVSGQQLYSPVKSDISRRSEPNLNKIKIYQSMEVGSGKHDQYKEDKSRSHKNSESDDVEAGNYSGKEKSEKSIYLSSFQKSLWIPEKEKFADKQLYGPPISEQEQKIKTLRPLKKITPKDQLLSKQKKNNQDQGASSDVESQKKKNDFEEELAKMAKQNKNQFAVVYKQNKLKMHQQMFEDYQQRKQELLDKRENRIKEDQNWQETLHQVSRTKSVKNISNVNIFNVPEKSSHRQELKTPGYMDRQMQMIQRELHMNSKSISNIPTLENGYSPNSISSIAAGQSSKRPLEVRSSVQIPNLSQSPENHKSMYTQKKLFLYQVSDADKNFVSKSQQIKQIRLTKEEIDKYEENLEKMKEKHREEERKKIEQLDKLKVSPEYRLMRKNSDELRRSELQSASSQQKKSETQNKANTQQLRVPYPTLSGLLPLNSYSLSTSKLDKNSILSSLSTSSNAGLKGNPYSVESNPQKQEKSPPTPKKQKQGKSQIITTTTSNVSQSVSYPAQKNPYVIQNNSQLGEDANDISNGGQKNAGRQQQSYKSSSQDNINRGVNQVTSYAYTTTSTTTANQNKKPSQQAQQAGTYSSNKQVAQSDLNKSKTERRDSNKTESNQKTEKSQRSDQLNTEQGEQNDLSNSNDNKQPIGNYKIQQHEYQELFSKGKIKLDGNGKHINWEDQVVSQRKPSQNSSSAATQKSNQNSANQNSKDLKNQQNGGAKSNDQSLQSKSSNAASSRQPNTYLQQKYSQDINSYKQNMSSSGTSNTKLNSQNQQGAKQPGSQQNQQQSSGRSKQNLNNDNSKLDSSKSITQPSNVNISYTSQASKNSKKQESNRGMDSSQLNKSKNSYRDEEQEGGREREEEQEQSQELQNSQYYNQGEEDEYGNQNDNDQSQSKSGRSGKRYDYGHDPNQVQGVEGVQGVKGQFSKFNAQGSEIAPQVKQEQPKRVPKVREVVAPPKKSDFVEQLEQEAQQDHQVIVQDEKVYLKPIESDDEAMFGYNESDDEEEVQQRKNVKKTNQVSVNQYENTYEHEEGEGEYEEGDNQQQYGGEEEYEE